MLLVSKKSSMSFFLLCFVYSKGVFESFGVVIPGFTLGVILFSILSIVVNRQNLIVNKFELVLLFFIFTLLLLSSSFLGGGRAIAGLYYSFLFFYFSLFFRQAFSNLNDFKLYLKLYVFISLFAVLISLIQFVLGFYQVDPAYPFAIFRTAISIFNGQSVYLFLCVAIAIPVSLYLSEVDRSKFFFYLSFFFFFVIFLTFSRKTLVSVSCVFFCYFFFLKAKGNSFFYRGVVIPVLIFLFVFFIAGSSFSERFYLLFDTYFSLDKDMPARTIFYLQSIVFAIDYFPFGVGPGLYGSAPAAADYSPLYSQLGYSDLEGLSGVIREGVPNYLMDTFWPHIIAEYGFIGFLLYIFLWFYPLVYARQVKVPREVFFLMCSVYFVIFVDSLGGSYPSQLYFIVIYTAVGALPWLFTRHFSR